MSARSLIAGSGVIRGTGALSLALALAARLYSGLSQPDPSSLVELYEHVPPAPPSVVRGAILIGLAALAALLAFSGVLFALRHRRDHVLMERGLAGSAVGLAAELGVALGLAFLGYFIGGAAMAGDANVIASFVSIVVFPALLLLFVQRRVLVLSLDEGALLVCRLGSPLAFVRRVALRELRVRLDVRDERAAIELEGPSLRTIVRGELARPALADELRASLRDLGAAVRG